MRIKRVCLTIGVAAAVILHLFGRDAVAGTGAGFRPGRSRRTRRRRHRQSVVRRGRRHQGRHHRRGGAAARGRQCAASSTRRAWSSRPASSTCIRTPKPRDDGQDIIGNPGRREQRAPGRDDGIRESRWRRFGSGRRVSREGRRREAGDQRRHVHRSWLGARRGRRTGESCRDARGADSACASWCAPGCARARSG